MAKRKKSALKDPEISERDFDGLRHRAHISRPLDEKSERFHYFKLYGLILGIAAPVLSSLIYLGMQFVCPEAFKIAEERLILIAAQQLYWMYFSWYLVFLTRCYMSINANGARQPARVDRPDQHVYKIMSEAKPFADAPYVLMEENGAVGRFNRAQRAAAHMDESLPMFITGTVLGAYVFGPVSLVIAITYAWARVTYANSYKEHKNRRLSGLTWIIATEHIAAGLILFAAVKSVFI